MKNKGRRHKSGNGPYANGNCKGLLCGITRDITKMTSPSKKKFKIGVVLINPNNHKSQSNKYTKKKWSKRVRGYFKSQTKEDFMITNENLISCSRNVVINTTGEVLKVGDLVKHQDENAGRAIILSFEINEELGEVKAQTDKGYAHIDFLTKVD